MLLLAAAVVAAGATTAAGSGTAGGTTPRCDGRAATIVGNPEERVIRGTSHGDVIWAGPGDHVVLAGAGSDVVCGGPGSDVIFGGRGDDTLIGGRAGHNLIYGGAGDDRLIGGGGDYNVLRGGLGIDVLRGGGGSHNVLDGGYGWDVIDGGSGTDNTASFAAMPRSGQKGGGVWASLEAHRAYGDGHDKLRRIENLEGSAFGDTLIGDGRANKLYGGPGNDTLVGAGGRDVLNGGLGSDRCRGGSPKRRTSCGRERVARAPVQVYLESGIDPAAAGVLIAAGAKNEDVSVALDPATATLGITAKEGVAVHPPCTHPGPSPDAASCPLGSLPRWLTVDLGAGNDRFRAIGSLEGLGEVRVDGGPGNDVLRGGSEEDLLEGGPGADRLYGGAGDDALVGGPGGPDVLEGGPGGDLLAAGSACDGGTLVGGPGRNDASFAEMPIQPGILYASLARGIAYVKGVAHCHPLRISGARDLEGTMGSDILIGNGQANHIIGQGGVDEIFGGGGEDVIDARDGVPDALIQCGFKGHPSGTALVDSVDPPARYCDSVEVGEPIPGFPHFPAKNPFAH